LLVVLALISLALALAVPNFKQTLETIRLKSDARQMASLLKLARQEAITTAQPRTVVFDTHNARYKINGQSYFYLKNGISFVGITTFTMRVNDVMPACGFSAAGKPSSGGTVTLQNSADRIYIIVNPVAGRVRVSEEPPANWN
jgi:general secretion pathway protein H